MARVVVAVLFVLLALTLPPGAVAAPPVVSVHASTLRGSVPLEVTLTAVGDATSYAWDLGDGATADGAVVHHTYARGGHFTARVTATSETGEAAQAEAAIAALAISLRGSRVVRYGRRATFRGRAVPATRGAQVFLRRGSTVVGRARTATDGRFLVRSRVLAPGVYRAEFEDARSSPVALRVRPLLHAALRGPRRVGGRLVLVAALRPASAGALQVSVDSGGGRRLIRTFQRSVELRLDTTAPRPLEIRLTTIPTAGFARARSVLRTLIRLPPLRLGSTGPAVRALETHLAKLRYAVRAVDGVYGSDTYEAVLAFQKVVGLPRTGSVTPSLWKRLRRAATPAPRLLSGSHLEVDKGRQILLDVRRGRVVRVVHVSTGATGNTPVGTWTVYRKVPGWDWVLWYPLYFLRGFAIHGYPFVPPYPASHGCVRLPMWIAPTIYAEHGYGTRVVIY
ncbi:MAG: PKD domain-containing protein [Actinomycetota bacterium]|nr:PKD domain-containing protein [Actinomycetota bacterium]